MSPENLHSKTTKLQTHTSDDKQNKQNVVDDKTTAHRSSSLSSDKTNEQHVQKEIMEVDDDDDETNADGLGCPSQTSTPVFTSTQTKLSSGSHEPVGFPDLSMIVQDSVGVTSSKVHAGMKSTNVDKKDGKNNFEKAKPSLVEKRNHKNNTEGIQNSNINKKNDRNNLKKNLKIVIKNCFNDNNDKHHSPSILDNIEHIKTKTHTNNEEISSPSILHPETQTYQDKQKKRLSSNLRTIDIKRQRLDTDNMADQSSSVVLLSSDEEGSSIALFGVGEKSHKDKTGQNISDKETTCEKISDKDNTGEKISEKETRDKGKSFMSLSKPGMDQVL